VGVGGAWSTTCRPDGRPTLRPTIAYGLPVPVAPLAGSPLLAKPGGRVDQVGEVGVGPHRTTQTFSSLPGR